MSMAAANSLFTIYGVELEYMLVDARTLDIRPISDQLFHEVTGEFQGDFENGPASWSNELVSHLVEIKTTEPAPSLTPLAGLFQSQVHQINDHLAQLGARLMPSAMHPWMDPTRETQLWQHEYHEVYETYDRIFNCRSHGWANLQSVHLNLPFADDDEFARLHAAIRLLLPILPALAASSPLVDGKYSGWMDTRLETYRGNSRRFPAITGQVIPEPVFSRGDYEQQIFAPMFRQIAAVDSEGTLQHEWLNSRGAIARFDRQAIEIRVLDVQETPAADVAICALASAVLRSLVAETWTSLAEQQAWPVEPLNRILTTASHDAEQALVEDPAYLAQFGYTQPRATLQELWQHLWQTAQATLLEQDPAWGHPLQVILQQGPLARRLTRAVGPDLDRSRLHSVYARLCDSLAQGRMFEV
jgi:gamma-glutamyl:cysteine ligase YbdK (ATP-grasp superfamily)